MFIVSWSHGQVISIKKFMHLSLTPRSRQVIPMVNYVSLPTPCPNQFP